MVFGHDVKPNFSVENEAQIQQPPQVDFGTPAPAPAPPPQSSQQPSAAGNG